MPWILHVFVVMVPIHGLPSTVFTLIVCVCWLSTVVVKLLERELVKVVVALMLADTSATSGIPIVALSVAPTAKELSCVTVQVALFEYPC